MIVDFISRLPRYESLLPGVTQVAAAYAAENPAAAPCEVREKRYLTKADSDRRFEVHFHTVDLMLCQSGAEVIHLCPMAALSPAEALPNGADGRKLNGMPQGTAVRLEAGMFCAILPGEAHMVGGRVSDAGEEIRKWVVKLPCPEAFCAEEIV